MTIKKIKSSDVLGDNYYIYNLTSSNYTPSLNGSIIITCTVKNIYGDAIANKSIQLYQNDVAVGNAKTTNSNGVATWTITCSTAGVQKFSIKDTVIEVFVDTTSKTGHNHTTSDITDFPEIPTKTSDLTDDVGFATNTSLQSSVSGLNGAINNVASGFGAQLGEVSSRLTAVENTKVDTAGAGLEITKGSKENAGKTIVKHTNNVSAVTSPVFQKFSYDSEGHITGKANVQASDIPSLSKSKISDFTHTHTTSEITNFPTLSNVATTGDYDDLSNKPSIPTVPTNVSSFTNDSGYLTSHQDISGKANTSDLGSLAYEDDIDLSTHDVSELTDNNDTSFTPKRHTHIISDVANLQTILNGKINISDLGNLAYEDDVDLTTHDVSELTDTQNTAFTPKTHTHGNLQNNGQVGTSNNASKNVVTDSNGYITTEAKPTIDTTITSGSSNAVTSGAIYSALQKKQGLLSLSSAEVDEYGNSIFTDDGSCFYSTNDRIYHDWGDTDELHFIDSNGNDVNFDDISLNGHSHNISNITNLQSTLNNKASLTHTHSKNDIDFQTTTSSFNIHLYETTEYMIDKNNFTIPSEEEAYFDFSSILLNDGDYVSFNITANGYGSVVTEHNNYIFSLTNGIPTVKIEKTNGILQTSFYDVNGYLVNTEINSALIQIQCYSDTLTGYFSEKTYSRKATWLDMIYPIGSIYISTQSRNPSLYFGGEWEQIQDRFLLASSSTYAVGTTGGEATHKLTENEMPSHTHTQNQHTHDMGTDKGATIRFHKNDNWGYTSKRSMQSTSGNYYYPYSSGNGDGIGEIDHVGYTTATNQNKGGGQAHNNMPPYLAVSVWERLA